jgi:hypothetical protein
MPSCPFNAFPEENMSTDATAATPTIDPGLWDLAQVAAYLQVSERTVKLWDAEGRLPAGVVTRLGGRKRAGRRLFVRAALEKWVGEGCPPPATAKKRRA